MYNKPTIQIALYMCMSIFIAALASSPENWGLTKAACAMSSYSDLTGQQ